MVKAKSKDKTKCPRGRTVILPTRGKPTAKKWAKWLEENSLSKAGPCPNFVELREKKWGASSLIVKVGTMFHLIAREDDGRVLPWEEAKEKREARKLGDSSEHD